MSIRPWSVLASLCLSTLLTAVPVAAQDSQSHVSLGYQFARYSWSAMPNMVGEAPAGSATLPFGWYADVERSLPQRRDLLLVGTVSGGHSSNRYALIFMGGARLKRAAGQKNLVFAHTLMGLTRRNYESGVSLQLGGGVVVPHSDRFDITLGADYVHVFERYQAPRFVQVRAGISLPIGRSRLTR